MSRIGIKSNRWKVVIVFGQATECHKAFVSEKLHIQKMGRFFLNFVLVHFGTIHIAI